MKEAKKESMAAVAMDVIFRVVSENKDELFRKTTLINCNLEADEFSCYSHLERKLMSTLKELTGFLSLGRCTYSITIRDQSLKKAYAIGGDESLDMVKIQMAGRQEHFDIVCKY